MFAGSELLAEMEQELKSETRRLEEAKCAIQKMQDVVKSLDQLGFDPALSLDPAGLLCLQVDMRRHLSSPTLAIAPPKADEQAHAPKAMQSRKPTAARAWTTQETTRLKRLSARGYGAAAIAEALGRTIRSVENRRRVLRDQDARKRGQTRRMAALATGADAAPAAPAAPAPARYTPPPEVPPAQHTPPPEVPPACHTPPPVPCDAFKSPSTPRPDLHTGKPAFATGKTLPAQLPPLPDGGVPWAEVNLRLHIDGLPIEDPWTPLRDLKLVTRLAEGGGISKAAAACTVALSEARKRWDILCPVPGIAQQQLLLKVLRARAAAEASNAA